MLPYFFLIFSFKCQFPLRKWLPHSVNAYSTFTDEYVTSAATLAQCLAS